MSSKDYEAKHFQYLLKRAQRRNTPARIESTLKNRIAGGKKASSHTSSAAQLAQQDRYRQAIEQAKAQGAKPGGIKKAAIEILRGGAGGRKRRKSDK